MSIALHDWINALDVFQMFKFINGIGEFSGTVKNLARLKLKDIAKEFESCLLKRFTL